MKGNLDAFYEGLSYEEEFGPSKVRLSMMREQLISTRAIIEAVSSLERKEIFGEDKGSSLHCQSFFYMAYFVLADNMASMKISFSWLKNRNLGPPLQVLLLEPLPFLKHDLTSLPPLKFN